MLPGRRVAGKRAAGQAGLILLFDGSIEAGDFVELQDGAAGLVVAIGPRGTTLRTNDHVDMLVPNGSQPGGT